MFIGLVIKNHIYGSSNYQTNNNVHESTKKNAPGSHPLKSRDHKSQLHEHLQQLLCPADYEQKWTASPIPQQCQANCDVNNSQPYSISKFHGLQMMTWIGGSSVNSIKWVLLYARNLVWWKGTQKRKLSLWYWDTEILIRLNFWK